MKLLIRLIFSGILLSFFASLGLDKLLHVCSSFWLLFFFLFKVGADAGRQERERRNFSLSPLWLHTASLRRTVFGSSSRYVSSAKWLPKSHSRVCVLYFVSALNGHSLKTLMSYQGICRERMKAVNFGPSVLLFKWKEMKQADETTNTSHWKHNFFCRQKKIKSAEGIYYVYETTDRRYYIPS